MFGRTKEYKKIDALMQSKKAEFVAIYGRRRVGKTYLIKQYFKNDFTFYHTGIANVKTNTQLTEFERSMNSYAKKPVNTPANWFDAFTALIKIIEKSKKRKKVIFIDELPWLDTPRSNFLSALEYFWNSWASSRPDIIFIICGSATSYIVNKIFNNKGGLHNRITQKIKLEPFTLNETADFLLSKKITWNKHQIIKAYMALGGIPFYLEALEPNKSIDQNIDNLFFDKDGLLNNEFYHLYASLFKNHHRHLEIINALATKKMGLTRAEILKKITSTNGGGLSALLEELELSDFITKYIPFGKKSRNSLYQLTDFFSLFYFNFIKNKNTSKGDWINAIDNPKQRAWSGYAFEMVCLCHTYEIKKALGISGVSTSQSSWRSIGEQGAQIDLVLDRRDQIIHLFEIKYSINKFTISKKYDSELRNKAGIFRVETKTTKAIFISMITTFGLKENAYAYNIQNSLTMDMLFEQI